MLKALAAFMMFQIPSLVLGNVPEIGKPAPDFELKDENGKTHKLSQYKGKIVVLEWTSSSCPFVLNHYEKGTMTKLHKSLTGKDVVWLAIDSTYNNTSEKTKDWAGRWSIQYPTLQDPTGKVGKLYYAQTTPHMFVIDKQGFLQYDGAIDDDSREEKRWATNYVQVAVNALLKNSKPKEAKTDPYGCGIKYAKIGG